jgi:CRISPR-associated protein Cmr4
VRDLNLTKLSAPQNWAIPQVANDAALIPNNSQLVIDGSIVLEEFTFTATVDPQVEALANWLAENAFPASAEYEYWRNKIKTDLVVLSNDAFKDFCQFSTDVVSRTKLHPEKKTVEQGALWTEENLPSDSLLYAPLFACDPRDGKKDDRLDEAANANAILTTVQNHLTNGHSRLQLGGNETVGRGIVATRVL